MYERPGRGEVYINIFNVMFCMVCGLRVSRTELSQVWATYGYGTNKEPTEFRVLWYGGTELTKVPGAGMKNFRSSRSSSYAYKCLAELPELSAKVAHGRTKPAEIVGRYAKIVPVPRICYKT